VKMYFQRISFFVLTLVLFSCNNAEQKVSKIHIFQGETQGTTYTIQVVAEKCDLKKKEFDSILADFDLYLSTYKRDSYISKFNESELNYSFEDKNKYFYRCLTESQKIHHLSDGAFDPTVFPLIESWGFFKENHQPLSKVRADSILQFVDFTKGKLFDYQMNGNQLVLKKSDPRLKFDFNAIAQGLSVDILFEYLEKKGYENIFVEIGGEIRVSGKNKEDNKWRIGIDKPEESEQRAIQEIVELSDCAIATSGNYRKFYTYKGKKYAHTIDPKTGMQVKHQLLSATVIASNATMADGYATAFMVMGLQKTMAFLHKNPSLKMKVILIQSENNGYSVKKVGI
jgi:FAD:protein FMN transferase